METKLWNSRYIIAVLSVIAACLIRFAVGMVISYEFPFLLFFTAVVLSAWVGGLKAGLLATILSAFAVDFFFLEPPWSFFITNPDQLIGLFTFVVECTLISVLFQTVHQSRAKLATAIYQANEARQLAEESNRAKKDFIANMSHEIRTPLTTILGFTELILRSDLPEDERERYVPKVQANVRSLSLLIDDILEITAIERGGMELKKTTFGLASLLHGLEDDLRPVAEQKGCRLEFRTKGFLPLEIETDMKKLHQILVHVISNAVKYTDSDLISVTMTLRRRPHTAPSAVQTGASLAFIVRSEGVSHAGRPGKFAPEAIAVEGGEKGLALPSSTAVDFRQGAGLELGLPLAKRLAKALGGDIQFVKTRRGRGSTFLVTMPIPIAPDFEDSIEEVILKSMPAQARPMTESTPLKGVKVLLVEDSPDNRFLVSRLLDMAGAQVETAQNGQEGVEMACHGNYNVVVMDIQMPVLDGFRAAQKLRERNFHKPLIALSAHAMREDQRTAIQSGFDDYLVKPVNRADLIEKVQRYAAQGLAPAFQ